MIGYQQGYAPMYSRRLSPTRLSQAAPAPGGAPSAAPPATAAPSPSPLEAESKLTPGVIRLAVGGGLVFETALGAAGAWVGLYTGKKAQGVLSIAGYTVSVVSAVSGLVSLAELVIYAVKGFPVPQIPAGPAKAQPAVPLVS